MALTMAVIGACAPCLRHIRCPISMIAPTLGIRTASERQEALQTLLSFICRGAACLLPCWHNVRRPSRTLFRKRHNTTHNIYGHLVIWSFGQNEEKKCCQNLYSIIYNIYYTIAQITHFHFLKMTKWPNDQMTTFLPLMTSWPLTLLLFLSLLWRGETTAFYCVKACAADCYSDMWLPFSALARCLLLLYLHRHVFLLLFLQLLFQLFF